MYIYTECELVFGADMPRVAYCQQAAKVVPVEITVVFL